MSTRTFITEAYRLDVSKDGTGSLTDASGDRLAIGRDRVAKLTDAFDENTELFNALCDLIYGNPSQTTP